MSTLNNATKRPPGELVKGGISTRSRASPASAAGGLARNAAPNSAKKRLQGSRPMKRSTDRIITTHAGSLSRPEALRKAWSETASGPQQGAGLQALLRSSVADVVTEQLRAGVDVPNDGEFGKPMRAASDLAAWGTYIFGRLSGFGPTPAGAAAPDRAAAGQPMRIVGQRWEQREFSDF